MSSYNKILNALVNTNFWNEYREYNKIKEVLHEFFKSEDADLQNAFIKNFDYPEIMVSPPIRFEESSGDLYYTINFKSKELFDNQETKEKALSNSLAVLDKYLPMGVVQHLVPETPIHIPDTFTLLCSLSVITEVSTKRTIWNIVGTILKPLLSIGTIFTIILVVVKYLAH